LISHASARSRKPAGIACICDGSNMDDLGDYRPGSKAFSRGRLQSPLKQFGFNKADIRAASRQLGLPTAEKPAMACLASRFSLRRADYSARA